MSKRGTPWKQVAGDVNPLLFGGIFTREKPDSQWPDMIALFPNVEDPKRKVEVTYWRDKNDYSKGLISYYRWFPAKIEVQRIDTAYQDPLNESWVNWEDVLRHTEETREPKDIPAWERVRYVGEYYGWANFGDEEYFTEGELRKMLKLKN